MRWHHLGLGWDVLEIAYTPLDLLVFWGGGERTRAAWRWAGKLAAWAAVGEA